MKFTLEFNPNKFQVLLRDLARHEKFNTRQLWEEEKEKLIEDRKSEFKNKNKNKNKYNKRNTRAKAKVNLKMKSISSNTEKILQKIQEKKQKKNIEKDLNFIKNSLIIHKINMEELTNKIGIMNTDKGRQYMKMAYLKKAFKRQDMMNTIDMYIEVSHLPFEDKKDNKILSKIKKKIDTKLGMSVELYQLYKLGERLPPLDFYNKHKFELEKWQKRVLMHIEKKNNVFLSAPTSAGKTIIVTNSILSTNYRVIILLPTEELALQVASSIHKFITKADKRKYFLWTENYQYTNINQKNGYVYDSSCDILISTPVIVEQNLQKIYNKYDYLIFDEIHCLNYIEIGPSIERIIHYFINSSFLALSATVANVEDICAWWKNIRQNTDIHIEKFNNRFINLERHLITDNKMTSLHPLGLITLDDLKNIENNSLDELAFCPKDLAQCWMSINSIFKDALEITSSVPEIYFKTFNTYRITLRQTKLYESVLKKLLVTLAYKYEDKTRELLELFKINNLHTNTNTNKNKTFMLTSAKSIRNEGLTPSLFFISNYSETLNYYKTIIQQLEKQVLNEWPFFRGHQTIRKEKYDKFQLFKKRTHISREKEKNNRTKNKKSDHVDDNVKDLIEDKYTKILQKEEMKYINELIELYETSKQQMENDIEEMEFKKNDDHVHFHIQQTKIILTNLNEYYKNIYDWTKLPYTSEYDRPNSVCFYKIALNDDEIDEIRRILSNELTMTISTSNVLLVGLYYGIGIYVKTLPVEYLRFLQKCAQNRKIGIMLSDRTLSMGINMPFLSVLLYQHGNDEFEQMEAVQMMGRCGRRNIDTTGHLVLCNVNPKKLLLKKKTLITGSNIKTPLLGLLPAVKPIFSVLHITQCTIKDYIMRKHETTTNSDGSTCTNMTPSISKPLGVITDYYTQSCNSWMKIRKDKDTNANPNATHFTPPIFSRNEKHIIWKSNTCFHYLKDLYGNLAAYYFVGYVNNMEHRRTLNDTLNNILDKSVCYILSSCYFHILLENPYKDSSVTKTLESFWFYFKNIKENKFIYNPLEQNVSVVKNKRANVLYTKLCEKMKNEKYQITDPLFVHYLYNMISFIKILSEIPYLKDTPIYSSFHRLFAKLRKYLLGSSSGIF
jgi:hypothetical protein